MLNIPCTVTFMHSEFIGGSNIERLQLCPGWTPKRPVDGFWQLFLDASLLDLHANNIAHWLETRPRVRFKELASLVSCPSTLADKPGGLRSCTQHSQTVF